MMELLEKLGLRQFHLFVSRKAGEEPLPSLSEAKESGGIRQIKLRSCGLRRDILAKRTFGD
ncbi:hypothetical protein CCB80_12880 [Armatimonadetes bacterium Uphvl-Ar1]|nr:hypothetical protein CCB80_12880 [Armatimonadetes bacterium Uphvl-Ar1]